MRVAMFIASRYGLECYEAVKKLLEIEIVGILTTPLQFILRYDKGQSKEMNNPIYQNVICEGQEKNVPIYITDQVNDEKTIHVVQAWKPDLIIVSGWYHIIKEKLLSLPEKGIIGLHASLLPRYRGGAPLVWQLIKGEKKSGITLFYIERGTDTGDIIGQKEVQIEENDDIRTLYAKVGNEGIELLEMYVPQIAKGCAPRKKQAAVDGEVYPQRREEDGRIDWLMKPKDIYNFVRAQTKPYPGAFSTYEGSKIFIWKCKIVTVKNYDVPAGTIVEIENGGKENYPIVYTKEKGYGIAVIDYSMPSDKKNTRIRIGGKLV